MNKTKVLIVGAGSIGALKPSEFDSPESKYIYTHAHACYSHPSIELVGIVDKDCEKALIAANKWNTKDFNNIEEFYFRGGEPEIVIVAVDTAHHVKVIKELIQYGPKVIICEKPFTPSYDDAEHISKICGAMGIKLIINYNRTWVPELQKLSEALAAGIYGEVYNFTLRYSHGLKRDGCHALHWCLQTFGEVGIYQSCDNKYLGVGVDLNDVNPHFFFEAERCPVVSFIPIGHAYSTYNADIYTEKGRIELLNNWKTIRVHDLIKSTYGDYPATGLGFVDEETQLDQALTYLLDNALEVLAGRKEISIQPALEVHKILSS